MAHDVTQSTENWGDGQRYHHEELKHHAMMVIWESGDNSFNT
jgi:hypothetical protein